MCGEDKTKYWRWRINIAQRTSSMPGTLHIPRHVPNVPLKTVLTLQMRKQTEKTIKTCLRLYTLRGAQVGGLPESKVWRFHYTTKLTRAIEIIMMGLMVIKMVVVVMTKVLAAHNFYGSTLR